MSKDRLSGFASQLAEDIKQARIGREKFDEKLVRWQRQYEAVPEQETKSFPWKNASNVVAPLTAIAVDAIEARLDGEIVAKPDKVNVKSLRGDDFKDLAEPLERYLNHAAVQETDLDHKTVS